MVFAKREDFETVEEKIGYHFADENLLLQAFTRRSFTEEQFGWDDNERLEFVGDKVLDLIIVRKLVRFFSGRVMRTRRYLVSIEQRRSLVGEELFYEPCLNILRSEGEMTEIKKKLVQTDFLARAIETLGLENYLLMGKGDIKGEVQKEAHVKEDLFEAILGAVALDSDWDLTVLESVVDRMLNPDYYIENGFEDDVDYITWIHNWYQKEYGKEPEYAFELGEDGMFWCELELPGYYKDGFECEDRSKSRAQKAVAKQAYHYLSRMEERKNSLAESVGEITYGNVINKVQELWQKKIIGEPVYTFREEVSKTTGDTLWHCTCTLEGEHYESETGYQSKIEAKRATAYEMVRCLFGKYDSSTTRRIRIYRTTED